MMESHDWQHHEDHVASLYRLLGYKVTHNINIDGKQADLVCEKWIEGSGPSKLYVDCKHTASAINKSVSLEDIEGFIYVYANRAERNGWTGGVMLSNRRFTQHAKTAAATHPNIFLKTIEELHEEILHIRAYLHDSVRRYKDSHHFNDYVPLYGTLSKNVAQVAETSRLLEPLVSDWLREDKTGQLCVFGDFGTGKTTFLEYLHYTLAERYLATGDVRIPILIPLRKYYEASDTADLIQHFFSMECAARIPYGLFQDFLTTGRLLLLLDGFDEMGARSDFVLRKTNYLKLAPLVTGRSKVIISCRPNHFLSTKEAASVFSFVSNQIGFSSPIGVSSFSTNLYDMVDESHLQGSLTEVRAALGTTMYAHLQLFDVTQIRLYLRKHNEQISEMSKGQLNSRSLLRRIKTIYDLEDLASRPILLKLIVNTLPLVFQTPDGRYEVDLDGGKEYLSDITPSVLYTVYTEKELQREYLKREWLIDRRDKVKVISALAFEMFRHDIEALDRARLAQIVQTHFPASETDHAFYITDIRTCSFLNRDGEDAIRFTHKSFMEYYTAVHIKMRLRDRLAIQTILSMKLFTDEVCYFLGDIIASSDELLAKEASSGLRQLYDELTRASNPIWTPVENIVNVLNYSRRPIVPLMQCRLKTVVHRKTRSEEVAIFDSSVESLRTLKSKIGKFHIRDSDIRRWECEDCDFGAIQLDSVKLRGWRAWECTIDKAILDRSELVMET